MSGDHDEDWEYYPGRIFSQQYGPRGGKRKLEREERDYWQLVSLCLQEFHGLGAQQARQKIYKLEERFMGVNPKTIEILYHTEPIVQAHAMIYQDFAFRWTPETKEKYKELRERVYE